MKLTTISTGIVVDRPTKLGRVFTRAAVVKALSNPALQKALASHAMQGGVIDRSRENPAEVRESTHITVSIRLHGDELVTDNIILDTDKGREIQKAVLENKVVAKPIIAVSGLTENNPMPEFEIMRVQLEMS